jgi:hypothetical protein
MIIKEIVTINDKQFKHTYSNANLYIQKVGTDEEYEEAFDVLSSEFTYVETEKQIPQIEYKSKEIESELDESGEL